MLRRGPLFVMLAVACGESTPRVDATNELRADEVRTDDRLAGIVEIQAFDGAVCARDGAGDVYCWGDQYGAAGLAGPAGLGTSERPRKIRGAHDIVRLGTHENAFGYATALRADGEIVVWPHVELRPRIEFVIKPDEKISDDDWVRINELMEGRRLPDRRVADPDPWHARATGLRVEAIDLFADTGCFYTAGLLSCAGLPRGIDLPRYDGLQWRYEPGIVDIAVFKDSGVMDPETGLDLQGACVLYADGKLECRLWNDGTKSTFHRFSRRATLSDRVLENRRVEVFFFGDGIAPVPSAKISSAGAPEYPQWNDAVDEERTFTPSLAGRGTVAVVTDYAIGYARHVGLVLELRSVDGAYVRSVEAPTIAEAPNELLEVSFADVPIASFLTLVATSDDGVRDVLFEDVPFAELAGQHGDDVEEDPFAVTEPTVPQPWDEE